MAPHIQTQHDPNLREPKNDQLNGFDPIAVFGFSINDPVPNEATIRARYHTLVRLIGVIYRNDNRLPYTLADVNRARENLLSSYRRTVEATRSYHRATWNPSTDKRDLAALLTPIVAGAQAATGATSTQSPLHIPVREVRAVSISQARTQRREVSPTGLSSSRPRTPSTNPHHCDTDHDSSDDDIHIVSSRSSVSMRKDPVSEVTKREMRQWTDEDDVARLASKGVATKGKGKATAQGPRRPEVNIEGADDDDVVYLGSGNEIPGYVMVGNDRRAGNGGRLMVMCVDCRNHANFYALQPTNRRIGGFRLERASYHDVNQSPAMLTMLRSVGELAPAHVRASREEMKAYYEVVMSQRDADARRV